MPVPVGQLLQAPAQSRRPVEQVMAQLVPSQVLAPLGSVGHGVHLAPQLVSKLFDTQAPEQRWVPALHWQLWVAMSQVPGWGHWGSAAQPTLHWPFPRSQ